MLNQKEILSTIAMIDQQHLDIRTITMGISLLSCCDPDAKRACDKIYEKITRYAEKLVKTGEDIQREFGIPIVNKRISVTPIALVAGASEAEDYVPFALALDRAAKTCGVNFIGGYSALVHKGFSAGSYKDMTRVAWLAPHMWAELFMENKEFLLKEIDCYIEHLSEYKTAMENDDEETLIRLLDEGKKRKEEVDG